MKQSRISHVRAAVKKFIPNIQTREYVSGPFAALGKRGEVSITVYAPGATEYEKLAICDTAKMLIPGCERAYVTKKNKVVGGNIKFVFDTRANGSPA